MAVEFRGNDADLWRKIKTDDYRRCAVEECFESLKLVLDTLLVGEIERRCVFYSHTALKTRPINLKAAEEDRFIS
jgi:hypothetical protein